MNGPGQWHQWASMAHGIACSQLRSGVQLCLANRLYYGKSVKSCVYVILGSEWRAIDSEMIEPWHSQMHVVSTVMASGPAKGEPHPTV